MNARTANTDAQHRSANNGRIDGDMPVKHRIAGYDVAKTLAMFFVVLLHFVFYTIAFPNTIAGNIVTTACAVCVPLFFAVNGALTLTRPFNREKHIRKIITTVVIVALWKAIAAVFFIVVDGSHPVSVKNFVQFELGGGFGDYPAGYFWLMNALIAVYLVFPLVKMAFDAADGTTSPAEGLAEKGTTQDAAKRPANRTPLYWLIGVIAAFTVGKDTLRVILQMAGTLLGHNNVASVLDSVDEYYIFGQYGYVLLYFVAGGLVAQRIQRLNSESGEAGASWKPSGRLLAALMAVIAVCYAADFGIQRYQHAATGLNFSIDMGYWLLPTFAATMLLLFLLASVRLGRRCSAVAEHPGSNTFGVYMLHMFAIVIVSKLQHHIGMLAFAGVSPHLALLGNLAIVVAVYLACHAVSWGVSKIPGIGRLVTLR
jgi:surface polysaccharide O-acyltransferase-like enzyme